MLSIVVNIGKKDTGGLKLKIYGSQALYFKH